MEKHDCQTRYLHQDEVDELFLMLTELIKYEGLADRFHLTKERMIDDLFGPHADWNCLVAVNSANKLVGFCLYTATNTNRAFCRGKTIQIDDLFVSPEYRGNGLGSQMLRTVAITAKQDGIVKINVFCVKDNEIGQNFYKKLGVEKLDFMDVLVFQDQHFHDLCADR
jgi:ribosomal protein S18 acetylase RimI-like enzyme